MGGRSDTRDNFAKERKMEEKEEGYGGEKWKGGKEPIHKRGNEGRQDKSLYVWEIEGRRDIVTIIRKREGGVEERYEEEEKGT